MKASTKQGLIGFGVLCMLSSGVFGCVPVSTDEASADLDGVRGDEADLTTTEGAHVAASGATTAGLTKPPPDLPPPPPLGCTASPTGGSRVECFYDARELVYTDLWKCTPPGDPLNGRCKTTTVGKSVSLTFFTRRFGQFGEIEPGISLSWRPSDAQGSVEVIIDGIGRGLLWQGGDSSGHKTYQLAAGLHTIKLLKPARDGDRAISIHSFVNSGPVGPRP